MKKKNPASDLSAIEGDPKVKGKKSHPKRLNDDLPIGMQKTREVGINDLPEIDEESNAFSAMETGRLDTDRVADIDNPWGVQGGRGPLNQEGEGNRQNDEAAELEEIEPDLDKRR